MYCFYHIINTAGLQDTGIGKSRGDSVEKAGEKGRAKKEFVMSNLRFYVIIYSQENEKEICYEFDI